MRKKFSSQFKAGMVRELLRENRPISKIASESKVAPTQLNEWKNTAIKGLVQIFEDDQRDVEKLKVEHEEELAKLYAEIGRLTTELGWLKKKSGMG